MHCSALRSAICVNRFLQAISETLFRTFAGAEERSVSREVVVIRFRFRSSIREIEYERLCASTCMRLLEWFAVLSNRIEKLSSTVNCLTLIWSILSKMLRLSYRASIAIRDEFCQRNLLSNDLMTKTVQFRCQNCQKIFELASTCTIDCNSLSKSYCDLCSVIYLKRQSFLLNLCRMLQSRSLSDEGYRSCDLCAVKTVTFAREICCRSVSSRSNDWDADRYYDSSDCYKKA